MRTCARYHDEQKKMEEREKREEEMRLRHIASTIARGVDYFWSNIEQVHLLYLYQSCFAIFCILYSIYYFELAFISILLVFILILVCFCHFY